MNSRDAFLSQLAAYTEEERYYLRCFELGQPAELRSGSETDSEESSLIRMERLPRFRPFKLHSHTSFEIFYIMSGTCGNQLDDRHYFLHPGDVGFLAPGVVHSLEVMSDSLVFSIHIRRDLFDQVFLRTLHYNNILSDFFMSCLYSRIPSGSILFPDTGEEIRDTFLDLYQESLLQDSYSERLMENLLPLLFARLLRGYEDQAYIAGVGRGQFGGPSLRMLSYINDHYQTISLTELAEQFGYSVPHCSRLIRQETGAGFTAFVRRIRMYHAASLLTDTGRSIAEISELVGYQTPEAFIRVFEKVYGRSPTQYRHQRT